MILQDLVAMDWLGFAMVVLLTIVAGLLVALSQLPPAVKMLVWAALTLRVVGTLGRHWMVTELYGWGDSFMYFDWGSRYAAYLWNLDFSALFYSGDWSGGKWWGTQFVRYVTGGVLAVIGQSMLAGYLVFSLFAFIGLVGFGMAFRRAYPEVPVANYLRWIWLFPSLWFWPSAIGKEAVILMGLGLATWGFVGRHGRINWLLLGAGIFLVFAVRAQVAAVLVIGLVLAHWLSLGGRWTLGRAVQGLAILLVGLFTLSTAMGKLGIDEFSVEGVQGYLDENSGRGGAGTEETGTGSAIQGTQSGVAGIPMALVNILVRPFPWEARNLQLLITSLEISAFWMIVLYRRRTAWDALRYWRSDRLLRLAIPFILFYSASLGMVLANMGIIARQRIFLFPFLFLLVEAVPAAVARAKGAARGGGKHRGVVPAPPPPRRVLTRPRS